MNKKRARPEQRRRILVVDDDSAILDVIKQILEDEGYVVETTNNGQTIEEVSKYIPDLILLDIWMSEIDGRAICKQLKIQNNTKHIPIIIISANKDTKQIAKEAGADDFIAKPFEIDELITMVNKYTR